MDMDYCHINPVKQEFVQRAVDWPYSTFHRYVERVFIHWIGLADQISMFREAKEIDSQTSPYNGDTTKARWLRTQGHYPLRASRRT
jgi:hypothetical protein